LPERARGDPLLCHLPNGHRAFTGTLNLASWFYISTRGARRLLIAYRPADNPEGDRDFNNSILVGAVLAAVLALLLTFGASMFNYREKSVNLNKAQQNREQPITGGKSAY
jgi:hypothetical protein